MIGLTALVVLMGGCSDKQEGKQPSQPASRSAVTTAEGSTPDDDPVADYLAAIRTARVHLTEVEDTELLEWGLATCGTARDKLAENPENMANLIEIEAGLAASEAGAPNRERDYVVDAALRALCPDVVLPN